MIKRLFDIVIAAVVGILCLPLALLIACAVWLESGSSIIYPSLRIGQFGNPFFYFRFRTMAGNPLHKTRFGRFIGNLSLDELPVLWNVAMKSECVRKLVAIESAVRAGWPAGELDYGDPLRQTNVLESKHGARTYC